ANVRVEKKEILEEVVVEKIEEKAAPEPKKIEIAEKKDKKEVPAKQEKDSKKKADRPLKRKKVSMKPDDLVEVKEHVAIDFLRETTQKMDLDLEFKAMVNKDNLHVDIAGKDAGTIIGKRGQTLDAVQYLTSLVVNKGKDDYVRVVVDAENYREKREKTLEQLADRLAGKVVKTGRSVRLEPMNPYERMVIHATLQDNQAVKTRSEGEEPYRRVIIELK
ncbi:MAG: RNA-binding cell elongation regulator Jag/EloR, partial [Anaerovoracaceae bacterium]